MAAVTSSLIGVGISGYMAAEGAKEKRQAKDSMNRYERQTLDNAFKDMPISTLGSDYLREENQRTAADVTEASRYGGMRGIFGNIPKIQAFTNSANREGQLILDEQVQKRNYAIAGDNVDIRTMNELRDRENLAALSSQFQSGKQDMYNGLSGVGNGLSGVAYGVEDQIKENQGKPRDTVDPIAMPQYQPYKSQDYQSQLFSNPFKF